ncbi:hypothetical protein HZB96_00880 [Candidatus Gottesmanbacteria bacterium]|nr:hypothetical protein [Candidatus Gottesmanbacteria bacterium]MBI5452229.1 hypothetical protein [Candidatus Gottesmanbacteria bacterium]
MKLKKFVQPINSLLLGKSTLPRKPVLIDGDTVVLEGKSMVRLRHLDAPDNPFCGSREARKTLEKLVLGKKVRNVRSISSPLLKKILKKHGFVRKKKQ